MDARLISKNFLQRLATGSILTSLFLVLYLSKNLFILAALLFFVWLQAWKEILLLEKKLSFLHYCYIWGAYAICLFWLFYEKRPDFLAFSFSLAGAHDVGGYLLGKSIGKHRIAPLLSPSKTWEGLLGSIGAGLATAFCWHHFSFLPSLNLFNILSILFCILLSFGGGLYSSSLKRKAYVKDSGDIFPGHGGALDRLDSILPLLWFLWLFPACIPF